MSSVLYLRRERSLPEAKSLFVAARNAEALAALGRNTSCEAHLLRARCLLRLRKPSDAVAALRCIDLNAVDDSRAAEYHMLLATSFVRAGHREDGRAQFNEAERVGGAGGGAHSFELAFYRALDAWTVRDLDTAAGIAVAAHRTGQADIAAQSRPFGVVRAQLLELESLIAASRENYVAQAALLIEAWTTLEAVPENDRDVWVAASLLRNLAPLVWDMHLADEADFLSRAVRAVAWTAEVASARYVAHRALAWHAALSGDHIAAFVRLRECIEFAPTIPWRILSMLDRAYLASEMRQTVIVREEMLRASELARSVHWESVVGEEAKVLLEIAEAYAREDAGLARQWLERYDRRRALPENLLLLGSDDRRQVAMEFDAQAAVLAAEGRVAEAVTNRRAAVALWEELQHTWRAARSAVALSRLTSSAGDAARALKWSSSFRRSFLARRTRGSSSRP